MVKLFSWKKKIFKNTFEIFSQGMPSGKLSGHPWKQYSDGEMNGRTILFRQKGFWKPRAEIVDPVSGTLMGNIEFNNWKTKATITYSGRDYELKYDNFWRSKWTIAEADRVVVRYHGNSMKGNIESFTDDIVLVLSGLYISNYFWTMAAAAAS